MPIIVNSPYSGRPVKVRDQDVGRAIRDEEGRIFYAVPKSDGQGYYGSMTRNGSPKDEERALEMQAKAARAEDVKREQLAAVHDATGTRRGGLRKVLVLAVLIAVLGVLAYVAWLVLGDDVADRLRLPTPENPTLPLPEGLPDQAPPPTPPTPQAAATGVPFDVPAEEVRAISSLFDDDLPAILTVEAPQPAPEAEADPEAEAQAAPDPLAGPAWTTTASGLRYRTITPGKGAAAVAGSYVLIHYDARFPGGPVLDSSRTTGEPTESTADDAPPIGFVLWSGQVIRGWDEGVAGMTVGERRELLVPAHLIAGGPAASTPAYAAPALPSSAGLLFTIDLVDVLPGILTTTTRAGHVGGGIASPGSTAHLHYAAYLHDSDRLFDDSRARPAPPGQEPEPFRFRLGAGDVIPGLDLAVAGMQEGERRTVVIPPYLAYGPRGVGTLIPPDATLRYELELVRVTD